MQPARRRTNDGFTLVELLIVVVLLGILAGIVVFAIGNATENTATKACQTEAAEFVSAYVGYQANHEGHAAAGATVADMAATMHNDEGLSASALTYLSPAAGQGGTVATNSSPRWTFDTSTHAVDTSNC